jgi:hypothetical protein
VAQAIAVCIHPNAKVDHLLLMGVGMTAAHRQQCRLQPCHTDQHIQNAVPSGDHRHDYSVPAETRSLSFSIDVSPECHRSMDCCGQPLISAYNFRDAVNGCHSVCHRQLSGVGEASHGLKWLAPLIVQHLLRGCSEIGAVISRNSRQDRVLKANVA